MRTNVGLPTCWIVACLLAGACGSSPSAPGPVATPAPVVVGVITFQGVDGTFLPTSTSRYEGYTFGCGDAEIRLHYAETAGGTLTARDYDFKLLNMDGSIADRVVDNRWNGNAATISPYEHSYLYYTLHSCVDYPNDAGPRAEAAINFADINGKVTQLKGAGVLTLK